MKIIKNGFFIFGPLVCGIIVGLLVLKPPFSPPAIVFPIAWTILYLLMGISFYIITSQNNNQNSIKLFIIQLSINYIWPFIFFKLEFYYFAAFWLLLLIYFVTSMIKNFFYIKKIAAYLQFPYLIWLLFALYLNLGVALLN